MTPESLRRARDCFDRNGRMTPLGDRHFKELSESVEERIRQSRKWAVADGLFTVIGIGAVWGVLAAFYWKVFDRTGDGYTDTPDGPSRGTGHSSC